MSLPNCPKCDQPYTYEDGTMLVCPMCFHEWTEESRKAAEEAAKLRDAFGNEILDGTEAIIAMDLKLGSDTIKQGTKVKNITILEYPQDGHDIQGRVDGFGTLLLKSAVIKVR
ncbi:MAG TPA: zinc ribbon domain-containing protein YjdM [Erysipelotrichaceae bacterium]|nr:zinc ribbon domain-containing protein YjdM [Erysipelotrichaceae bacterium]